MHVTSEYWSMLNITSGSSTSHTAVKYCLYHHIHTDTDTQPYEIMTEYHIINSSHGSAACRHSLHHQQQHNLHEETEDFPSSKNQWATFPTSRVRWFTAFKYTSNSTTIKNTTGGRARNSLESGMCVHDVLVQRSQVCAVRTKLQSTLYSVHISITYCTVYTCQSTLYNNYYNC